MEILKLCQKRYALNIHRIRYEDLVLDFRGEVSNTLAFLDLKWEEQLRNYQKTAFAREIINTPSYSQVVKPIYNTASYSSKAIYSNQIELNGASGIKGNQLHIYDNDVLL